MREWLDRSILFGLLTAVCIAPWLFGSVEQYAVDALGIFLLLLLGLALLKALMAGELKVWLTPVHVCLLLFLAACLLQVAPLPESVGARFLPDEKAVLPPPFTDWRTISIDPSLTLPAVVKLAVLVGYFMIAAQSMDSQRRVSVVVHTLVLLGVAVALAGILHKLTPDDKILWIRPSEFAGGSFGPFVNRNHFAGLMVLLFPLPLAMIFSRGVSRDRWVLYGFCAVTMACAAVYSLSRGGLMSLGIELLLLPMLADRERLRFRQLKDWDAGRSSVERRWPARLGGVILIAMIIGLGVIWIGAEPLMSRWAGTKAEILESRVLPQSRPATWRVALRIFEQHPLFGVGLGAFPRAYPLYDESPGVFTVGEAHNDYLQILSDTGLVGGALGGCFLYFLVTRSRRALGSPRREDRAAALGATVGVCGILVHSLVDFNLQITSNGLVFLVLVAIVVSTELRARVTSNDPRRQPGVESRGSRRRREEEVDS
ncbi:MAG: O-antigen ligase family protein [Acidobacteria bacterium]|nr:O-antigen ligase family protein [Acidobacteriota bacterium]